MSDTAGYLDAHEHMAMLAIEGTDRQEPPEFFEALVAKVEQDGGNVALLLALAIALADERALRGESPEAPTMQRA
jgi:hypothetical protein